MEDPIWQRKFTVIWGSFLAGAIIISIPSVAHAFRRGRALIGLFGLSGGSGRSSYSAVVSEEKTATLPSLSRRPIIVTYWDFLRSVRQWSVRYLNLNAGQSICQPICMLTFADRSCHLVFILATYLATTLVCIIKDAPLISNPNRAGA